MSRSSWKPTYIDPQLMSQIENIKEINDIVVFNRNTILTEEFIGQRLHIYNGFRFFSIEVDGEKIGHRIGEFSPKKKKPIPKKKKEINGTKSSSSWITYRFI